MLCCVQYTATRIATAISTVMVKIGDSGSTSVCDSGVRVIATAIVTVTGAAKATAIEIATVYGRIETYSIVEFV